MPRQLLVSRHEFVEDAAPMLTHALRREIPHKVLAEDPSVRQVFPHFLLGTPLVVLAA
jgi:hypothetical protein